MRKAPLIALALAGGLAVGRGGKLGDDYRAARDYLSSYRAPETTVSLDGAKGVGNYTGDGDAPDNKPARSRGPKRDAEGWVYPDNVIDRNPDGSYAYDFSDPAEVFLAYVEACKAGDKTLLYNTVPKGLVIGSGIGALGRWKHLIEIGKRGLEDVQKHRKIYGNYPDDEIKKCGAILRSLNYGRPVSQKEGETIREIITDLGLTDCLRPVLISFGLGGSKSATNYQDAIDLRRFRILKIIDNPANCAPQTFVDKEKEFLNVFGIEVDIFKKIKYRDLLIETEDSSSTTLFEHTIRTQQITDDRWEFCGLDQNSF